MFLFDEYKAAHYLDVEHEDFVVSNLLTKYNIHPKASFLYNQHDDYDALIEYICTLYFDKTLVPQDICNEMLNNLNFRAYLLVNIRTRMNNILSNNTTIIFKEIVTIVHLLSLGKEFEIFENYNFYNLENLAALFREYEETLKSISTNTSKEFNLVFEQYTILIEIINELCTINSTDIQRKKTINSLIELLTESINLVKFNCTLKEEQLNILNNILGKFLFYYSHIPFIKSFNKNAQYLIDEYKFNFEKICNGYHLSKNTQFGGDENYKEYYKIYLNSLSILLCTLLHKLENHYTKEDYSIDDFTEICELYEHEVKHTLDNDFNTIEGFKKSLLNNFVYIYNDALEETSHEIILDDFINTKEFNSHNMHILNSIIQFSSTIAEEKYIKVLEILMNMEKLSNDYHEFYKLNICDIIINKFIHNKSALFTKDIIHSIVQYVEKNKIASHLMAIYSKIYLSLSLYYSYFKEYEDIEISKLYYFNFIAINTKDLLENEYLSINNEILYNYGKASVELLELENLPEISKMDYIRMGTKQFKTYSKHHEISLKYEINQKLSNIVTQIFTDFGLSNDLLNTHIEHFISRDIFHGLAFVSIDGLCERGCRLIDLGYEKIEIPLIEGYKLKMAYSRVYQHVFENIYEKNKEYIKQNIINIIISYLKSIPIYHDSATKLSNLDKLKLDIEVMEEEFVFIQFYINNLFELNKKYGYQKTNELFKEYGAKIDALITTYRLNGPKLGFFMQKDADYHSLIEKIKGFDIAYNDETTKLDLTFTVSWGTKENILNKASHAMHLAMNKNERYCEFK